MHVISKSKLDDKAIGKFECYPTSFSQKNTHKNRIKYLLFRAYNIFVLLTCLRSDTLTINILMKFCCNNRIHS